MSKLNLDQLTVETFATASDVTVQNYTMYAGSCGCGTEVDCGSDDPNCTEACIVESNATDWINCCG